MASTIKDIEIGKTKIYNPEALYVTPYVDNVKGTSTYKLDEVIQDTTSILQDDPETTEIKNEFSSANILENVLLGSFKFSADVADMQSELLEKLCGYKKGVTATDKTFAPSTYVPVYAEIALTFRLSENKVVAAILPKVQLNSKATFESLSSNMAIIRLAGTGLNAKIQDGETQVTSSFYIDYQWTTSEL